MSITITNNPEEKLLAAYRPINYEVQILNTGTGLIPAVLEMEYWVNGRKFSSKTYQHDTLEELTDSTYTYQINASEEIQPFFADNESVWGEIDAYSWKKSDAFQGELIARAYEWLPDEDGKLQKVTTEFKTSEIRCVINAAVPRGLMLEDYMNEGSGLSDLYKYLTNKPTTTIINRNESEFVAFWGTNVTHTKITSYDLSGAQIAAGYLSSVGDDNKIVALGIGPSNINASTAWVGTPIKITKNVGYYTIQSGTLSVGFGGSISFTPKTEIRTYYIDHYDCASYRIHFLNRFGFQDSVTVRLNEDEEYRTQSSSFTQSPSNGLFTKTRTRGRVQSFGESMIGANVQGLSPDETRWLKELQNSPNVSLQELGEYVPVEIEDITIPIANSEQADIDINFKLKYSNVDYSQRN